MRMMKNPMDNALEPRRPAWSRPEVVFTTAALVLLGAFLVPVSPTFLSVIWICTFCLAGAVAIICLAAGSSADLIGFVPLISAATLLRLTALAAASRRIAQQDLPDPLTSATGVFLSQNWPLGAMLVCLLIAAVISIVVFAASQRVFLASAGYIQRILPLKRVGIETDMRMGVITEEQAQTLAQRIVMEFRFFAGMHGVATLIRGEIAIIVVILIASVLMPALSSNSQTLSGQEFISQSIPPVVGLAVFTLIPAVITAAACGSMMSRDTLALRSEHPGQNVSSAKKITIVAKESGSPEEIELLNPDFTLYNNEKVADFEPVGVDVNVSQETRKTSDSAFEEALQTARMLPSACESLEAPDSAACADPKPKLSGAVGAGDRADTHETLDCRSAEEYYETLSRMILSTPMPARVLLAAEIHIDLPVTVAVNVAIRLAQKQKKVLLVDSDISRSALAQVFELDRRILQKQALPTCFENLSVCGVSASKLSKLLQKSSVARSFDVIMVYAPDSSGLNIHPSDNLAAFCFSLKTPPQKLQTALGSAVKTVPPMHSVLSPRK
jgi:hypothetical protein